MIAFHGLPGFLTRRLPSLRHLRPIPKPGAERNSHFRWLIAPTVPALAFAVRTTAAALLALVIALWMELDDPQWAPMTVWIVAQGSRGESLSKARWRIVGTIFGVISSITLIAAFPQQPWLFFPALSIWLGLCCMMATLVHNFRAYALVLMGYTCAIIALGAQHDPEHVFLIAMSRATYIYLGIACEGVLAALFAHNLAEMAHRTMRAKLRSALISVTGAIGPLLEGHPQAIVRSRSLFGPLLSINDQIEFSEVEMGPHAHEGDHARAALAAVSVLLSRGLGMAVRLQALGYAHQIFRQTAEKMQALLSSVPTRLETDEQLHELHGDLQLLRAECRQRVVDSLISESDLEWPRDEQQVSDLLDQRILHNALDELIGELEVALREFEASHSAIPGDHFRFRLQSHRDWRDACYNGIRAGMALLIASQVWLITAWPAGQGFITFVGLVCGLFATRENPIVATMAFLKGSLIAALVALITEFLILPTAENWEMLVAILTLPMIAGGLASRNPSTALPAIAYTLLFPNFVHPINTGRLNEIAWFNSTIAILLAVVVAVLAFRTILPFSNVAERWRMRRMMLQDMQALAAAQPIPQTHDWTGRNIDRFSRVIRHAGPTPSPTIEGYLQGTLATMTIGLNVIRLRNVLERGQLSSGARRGIEAVLERLARFTGHHEQTARSARIATQALRRHEAKEANLTTRIELTRAIAYLIVVSNELTANAVFLDTSKPYRAPE
ncbi:FUSC family protein [Acetobacter sp. AN02]|uniref:FUSC family protein n=1 Tax=Acetobacter sp. AN02 TaxID=2894186 RepID=UPI00243420E8|nr:FUSC family protein [Acetobacter sp. AN02]MDG6094480.1 FUSC family protein [Acetobacter sp. AN02]